MRTYNKIAVVMKSGEPVTIEQFKQVFTNTKVEPVLYRLSTYIWNIKRTGGIVKSIKDGRKVVAYQLLNGNDFNSDGIFKGEI
jgi:hypothetical protein